jgi:hypothetical protein
MLCVVAGDGTSGALTYGGPATDSALTEIRALAFDPHGALYLSDQSNQTIDRVDLSVATGVLAVTGVALTGVLVTGGALLLAGTALLLAGATRLSRRSEIAAR